MAAYTNLAREVSGDYEKVKAAILQRYEVNEETHQRKFSQDKKRSDKSYREFFNWLQDRFQRWAKFQELTWEQMILIEQVYSSVPAGSGCVVTRKEAAVRAAADRPCRRLPPRKTLCRRDYTHERGSEQPWEEQVQKGGQGANPEQASARATHGVREKPGEFPWQEAILPVRQIWSSYVQLPQ